MSSNGSRRPIDRLVFVYAADSGLWSAVVDSAKKLFTVKGCSLCAITHGLAGERFEWRECKEELGVPIDVYHRDDMPQEIERATDGELPKVLARVGDELVPILGPDVLERMRGNVADFRGRLTTHAAMRGLEIPTATAAGASTA